jgi:amidohydrolase
MTTDPRPKTSDLKDRARATIDAQGPALVDLSHRIHGDPEIGWQEVRSSALVADALGVGGFDVTRSVAGMPTAFLARTGDGPLHLAILAEYDALPRIGHACGHNIIAASSCGAALALAPLADELGMTVTVLGSPAEEVGDGGGKQQLIAAGAFDDVHLAMMVHPAPYDASDPPMIAASMFEARYTGKEAHASAAPELGINAGDALTVAQVAIGLLRQSLLPTARVHGFVTHGGEAPNIIPAHTSARYIVRGWTLTELEDVRTKVLRCFEAGALATGATLEIVGGMEPYAEVRHDPDLAARYQANAETLGRVFGDLGQIRTRGSGSTDMGNVSHLVPTIHPFIRIETDGAVNHQPEFTAAAATPSGDQAVVDAATAMAWTAIDAATEPELRARLLRRD